MKSLCFENKKVLVWGGQPLESNALKSHLYTLRKSFERLFRGKNDARNLFFHKLPDQGVAVFNRQISNIKYRIKLPTG